MLKNFMLSVRITAEDSKSIKEHLNGWNKQHETEYYCSTNSYRNIGFSNIRVYDFINKSKKQISFLTITVNPMKIKENTVSSNNYGYELNTAALYNHIKNELLPKLKRYPSLLLRDIIFSLDLLGNDTSMYMQLFRMGFPLDSWNMKQRIFVNDSEIESLMAKVEDLDEAIFYKDKFALHYKNPSSSISLVHYKGKNTKLSDTNCFMQPSDIKVEHIHFEIMISKYKIQNLMKKHGIKNRKIYDFSKNGFLKELENQLFHEYIGRITRKGDYYNLDEASKIIQKSSMNMDKKNRLIEVLVLISECKGIGNFLDMISAGAIERYSNISTMEEYFRNYEKLGINPVLLPDTYSKSFLRNPLKLLDELYSDSLKKHSSLSKEEIPPMNIPEELNLLSEISCEF